MPQLSVKIKIGDREYPMKVDSDDEQRVRAAGKKLNEKMREFSAQFGIHDKQDLLAMVAFETLVEQLKDKEQHSTSEEGVSEALTQLNAVLDSALKEG